MSEFKSYLQSVSEDGQKLDRGGFTLSGEAARKALAESVPEKMRSPFAAVACLVLAAQDLGLRIEPLADFDYNMDQNSKLVLLTSTKSGHDKYVETLIQAYKKPFQASDLTSRKLSRAMIILEQLGESFSLFQFGTDQKDFPHSKEERCYGGYSPKGNNRRQTGPKAEGLVIEFWRGHFNSECLMKMPNSRRVSRILAHHRDFYQFSLLQAVQDRVIAEPPNVLGFSTQRDSLWTRLASRDIYIQTELCPHTDWFYDRVSREVIVLEYLVPTDQSSPLVVASSQVGECGRLLKPGEDMSSWDRFRSQAENLILHYTASPEELTPGDEYPTKPKAGNTTPMKAIFTVGLSKVRSRVAILSDDAACELVSLHDLPPGLVVAVYWPGLKTDLYGEGWVRDGAFDEVLAWCYSKGKEIFQMLASESEYVQSVVDQDHVRSSYRTEVRRAIGDWLSP